MFGHLLIAVIWIALAMSLFLGVYALFRGQSTKNYYLILMQTMIAAFLFGYILELTSTNVEEAYLGLKIMDATSSFLSVFVFFFVADFCNIKIRPIVIKFLMLLVPSFLTVLMWTGDLHRLIYRGYYFTLELNQHINFSPGILYFLTYLYPLLCLALCLALLIYQMFKWKNKYRKQLLLLMICIAVPFLGDFFYYITFLSGMNKYQMYFTPFSLVIMSFLLYLGVMRFNIFEIISMATSTAMEHIKEGFVLVDEHNNYLYSNPAAIGIVPGISAVARGDSIFLAEDWPDELGDLKRESVEFSVTAKEPKYFRASINPVFLKGENLKAKIILIADVTDSVNLMKELESAAYIDSLTGLYNRKHFLKLATVDIERAIRMNQTIYTGMLDLDFFKKVNDTYGHAAGDLILKTTAGIIRQTIRSYDLLGRFGGEEFVLLFTDLEPTEAFTLMQRIRENMESSITVYEGVEIRITCSIGFAEFVKNDSLENAIKNADEALYIAKNSGRNQVQLYCSSS